MKHKIDKSTWKTLIAEHWVFGLSCGADTFLDSFALLRDSSNRVWKFLIQSKLRKGGAGDHNFSQADLNMQIDYVNTNCDDDKWIMIIRTDSSFVATIPTDLKKKIFVFDAQNNHHFYTPVIYHAREVSTLQMLGEAWESTMSEASTLQSEALESTMSEAPPLPKLTLIVNNRKRFLENYLQKSERPPKMIKLNIPAKNTNFNLDF